jgi:hypothetical protein
LRRFEKFVVPFLEKIARQGWQQFQIGAIRGGEVRRRQKEKNGQRSEPTASPFADEGRPVV